MSTILRGDKYCTILAEEEADGMFSDVCTKDEKKLWEYGIIPYVINDNVPENLKGFVEETIGIIVEVSHVKFVKRTCQSDYIEIIYERKFASYVGRIGGRQELYVSIDEKKWPHPVGNVLHELMHALGFYHEHCRPDRDQFLKVESNNKNYAKQLESDTVCYGPYDPESIMHYPLGPKMTSKQEINAEIGQRKMLSDGDIYALNNLYPYTLEEEQTLYLSMLNGTYLIYSAICVLMYEMIKNYRMYEPMHTLGLNVRTKLWENGIVPYVFDEYVSEELKGFVEDAMKRITEVSSVKFVKRTYQCDYIEIINGNEFASYVGRMDGKQELYVTMDENKWPHPIGCAMHELMHALGFYHEHCHPDRDEFLEANTVYCGSYDPESTQ